MQNSGKVRGFCRKIAMKSAKRRSTYPAVSFPPALDALVDAEVQEKGYSNHPEAMQSFSKYLQRAIAFEQKQRYGR
jgi:hypothetical protein